MPGSGSEKRQRQIILKARFTEPEAALVQQQADAAGLTVSALIRFALLNQKPPKAARKPPAERELVARVIAALGPLACEVRQVKEKCDDPQFLETIDAVQRDLAELRVVLFEALGRQP